MTLATQRARITDFVETEYQEFGAELPEAPSADLFQLVDRFASVRLDQMDAVALQNRTDTKYVTTIDQLYQVLSRLDPSYLILDFDGIRLSAYQTLYFDSARLDLYLKHHDQRSGRYKLRSRRYMSTGQSFLEVKRKSGSDRTIKQRVATDSFVTQLDEHSCTLLSLPPEDVRRLEPALWNNFWRMTLVNIEQKERCTIDVNVEFSSTTDTMQLSGLAIVEVKQHGINRQSPLIREMRAARIRQMDFSKYCVGVAMLYNNVKRNKYKPTIRQVQKLTRG